MAQYALVKDGVITNLYDSIPVVFGNEVSGFHNMTDKEREKYGFFPIAQPDKSGFDPEIHDIVKEEHKLVKGKPVYVFEYVTRYTEEQILQLKKEKFWAEVRINRNSMLASSDWAMMRDVVDSKGEAWLTAWATYRQALRDITLNENLFDEHNGVFSSNVLPKQPEL